MKRALALLLTFLGVRAAYAGEQLTLDELVRRSAAVAVVERQLPARGAERSSLVEWLREAPPGTPTDVSRWGGLCVPSRAILSRWLEGHPRHPGRATWQRTLDAGAARQIVFLELRNGELTPTCETEVMLGTTLSTHPDFEATRARVGALLATSGRPTTDPAGPATPAAPAPAAASTTASTTASALPSATTPAAASPSPAQPQPPPAMPEPMLPAASGAGCW